LARVVLVLAFLIPLVVAGYVLRALFAPARLDAVTVATATVVATAAASSATATAAPTAAPTRTPLPALPPTLVSRAVPAASVAAEAPSATPPGSGEWVVVANTGGIGGVVRDQPVTGRQVAALREGQRLMVLERSDVNGAEWVHVRTEDGATEGWVSARIVTPAPPP
jgi:Bacterial SH3 domain